MSGSGVDVKGEKTQLTLSFSPSVVDRFPTLRQYVSHRSVMVAKLPKAQAAEMDIAPSTLSRKLNPQDGDTQRFNLDDLERWLDVTGDAPAIVEYLAAKFMDSDEARRSRAIGLLEQMLPDLAALVSQAKGR